MNKKKGYVLIGGAGSGIIRNNGDDDEMPSLLATLINFEINENDRFKAARKEKVDIQVSLGEGKKTILYDSEKDFVFGEYNKESGLWIINKKI